MDVSGLASKVGEVHAFWAESTAEAGAQQGGGDAVTTCGRNSVPCCVLDRSYSLGSVKTVLAAGNVTSTMPCATPAA